MRLEEAIDAANRREAKPGSLGSPVEDPEQHGSCRCTRQSTERRETHRAPVEVVQPSSPVPVACRLAKALQLREVADADHGAPLNVAV